MNIIEGKKPVQNFYNAPGALGVIVKQPVANGQTIQKITWFTCREQFHSYIDVTGNGEYYYSHKENQSTDVARFIYQVENHLGIKEKSKFTFTDSNKIVWVAVSPWWLKSPMRHSFFTICLRSALDWNETFHFMNVLLGNKYLITTPLATDRFLKGFTRYTGNIVGWYRQFTGADLRRPLTQQEIDKLLVSPRQEEIEKIAYFKWEKAGCPAGKDFQFWIDAAYEYDKAC